MMVCRLVPLLVGGVFAFQTAAAQQAPRPERPALVVNMVVGGLPYDFVTRYGHNLSEGGFRRLAESGVSFTSARYDYMPTDRASSLATITTGTYPSVHGVVGERWCDVLTGEEVELIADSEAAGFDCEYGQGCYSNVNLIAPTLGDRLRAESPASKVVSIAADPVSAIVMAGLGTEAYWVNTATAGWTSSSRYMLYLPGWVERFNDQYRGNSYLADWFWTLHLGPERYVNRRYGRIDLPEDARFRELAPIGGLPCTAGGGRYVPVFATPLASDLVADFAMQAVVREELGQDEAPDILNICFDAPRDIIA
ncbi:MAG: alkaline phosphatase family protein, partial [Alistipes inops]